MNRRNILAMLTIVAAIVLGAGCGGGGGGSSSATPTTVVLTLSTSGTLPGSTLIGGSDVNIILPTGVSVKAAANVAPRSSIVTYSGVVTVSGVAVDTHAMALATLTGPNTLNVKVVNPNGFGVGEFAKVTCAIDAGAEVVDTDFSTTGFAPVDVDGVAISGLTASLTATIQ